ncbi:MAG TPA: MMPL family transporter [Segeticoccus sp.]|uniref:MMPL family transporter n=1 Tax=Segeticoccus sp. TaxID=2706531 RepID=UPI002D80975A|nr:MMPL family transporter [Segeticoccus sp.]HET8601281.1 MMPL family transporter [Segeticoccus sp.]
MTCDGEDVIGTRTDLSRGETTSPGGVRRWGPVLAVVAVLLAWLAVAGAGGPLVGRLSEVQQNDNASFLPAQAESTLAAKQAKAFGDSDTLPYLLVIVRRGGLQPQDLQQVQNFLHTVPGLTLDHSRRTMGEFLASPPGQVIPSTDREALLAPITLTGPTSDEVINGTGMVSLGAEALRHAATRQLGSAGLQTAVTGPGGYVADLVTAFSGIDGVLLIVALAVVLFILLLVYRSPILPIAVLLTSLMGLAIAALVIYPLAKHGVIELSGQSQGILMILVVGASTDYALLLVARYREELHQRPDRWTAMRVAWRAAVEPIAASGATVILGLLCLLLSELGNTSGLGPVGSLGIAGALVAALTFLPAVLLLIGRRVFWPMVPRVDHVHSEDSVGKRGIWGRVAGLVGRRPRLIWAVTALCLVGCACFLPTFHASGMSQDELFLGTVDSVTGQKLVDQHYAGGLGAPAVMVAPQGEASRVAKLAGTVDGVSAVSVGQGPGRPPKVVDGNVMVQATLSDPPNSPASEDTVQRLRDRLDSVSTDILVGGQTAAALDVRLASDRDLRVIIPAILGVIFLVLILLLRALVAPLVLVLANVLSFAATIGVSALVFNHLLGFPHADPAIPLYSFVFLVALGIDYSIFLMTRVREESVRRGTRPGVLVGLAVTGGVITSAGVVLAATFSALSVIPLLFLVQVAFIVAFGVLLDTLVVRSLLVPALVHDLGRHTWWPSLLGRPLGRHERTAVLERQGSGGPRIMRTSNDGDNATKEDR